MNTAVKLTVGSHTDKGRKPLNQDFHDLRIPDDTLLCTKGAAAALADGISSSEVSQVASQVAVVSFLEDYFSTPETWSVGRAARQVLKATNSWLYAQTRRGPERFDMDKGYVCTFSALVLRGRSVHLFHIGDARIYRLRDGVLEQQTEDHRLRISPSESYLSRAMGMDSQLIIDHAVLSAEAGDVFLLMTDGVYEHILDEDILQHLQERGDDYDGAAEALVNRALENGSGDNLTLMLMRIDALPDQAIDERYKEVIEKPFAPLLEPRSEFEGYRIVRTLSRTSRSHVYLAVDMQTDTPAVLKTLATELQHDRTQVERFLTEEWIARRVSNAHLLKAYPQQRPRAYLYTVTEYVEGQSLAQWMTDNPRPDLETVRRYAEQIARGLLALHRREMVHQDLRPENILIDATGTLKIIDFGSVKIEGIQETVPEREGTQMPGTAHYSAPEYFLGGAGTTRSDLYSLAAILYRMLSGSSPYGLKVARTKQRSEQKKLKYVSLATEGRGVPVWFDEALRKALDPDPERRYEDVAEFVYDLRHPNRAFLNKSRPPLIERDPVRFWQGLSLLLGFALVMVAAKCLSG
ncbi:protein kinase [Sulfurimonas sp. HSL-3221]|uniref:bifunctional protein-serine/threonine kinase/phosphatase n=1 Tax=Sulfurimonadaceae TaxID=2771471 RepID=UPI001E2EBE82|nr:bifunctional protein-serine/threonine kinase/phosphatase [Sulfurimonas sp. HSL-3221]UFS63243.1 protein kinase [Sulfurimonas sp. HSL-3221]